LAKPPFNLFWRRGKKGLEKVYEGLKQKDSGYAAWWEVPEVGIREGRVIPKPSKLRVS